MRLALTCLGCAALLGVMACNDPADDLDDGNHRPAALPKPAVEDAYPEGPYAVAKGSVVPNYRFSGFPNALADSSAMREITFGDFYNPHAGDPDYHPASDEEDDRLFPPGSPYGAGTKKPTGMLVDIASVWCAPCNDEAKNLLPGLYARYKPCGGEIFFQLIEAASPGTLAAEKQLKTWTKVYKVDYPAMIDPLKQLQNLYQSGSYPNAAVIDTRTMRMVEVVQGVPDDSFWAAFEAQLDPACLAEQ